MRFSRLLHIYRNPNTPMTQEELVEVLNKAKYSGWDIPSALGSLCDHRIMDEGSKFDQFPMHRPFPDYAKTLHIEDPWPLIDDHFTKVHQVDLSDHRINWDFDT